MNCWDIKHCGREQCGSMTKELGVCPAYPDKGKQCAGVVGTLCGGKAQGIFATKLTTCIDCKFYKSDHYKKLE